MAQGQWKESKMGCKTWRVVSVFVRAVLDCESDLYETEEVR